MLSTIILTLLTSAVTAWDPFFPGNPKLYNPLWVSNTTDAQFNSQHHAFTAHVSGFPLIALSSNTNTYFEDDGNLNTYDNSGLLWSTNLPARDCASEGTHCSIKWQSDGNLVIYVEGVAVWYSGTGGVGKILTFSSRGSLVWVTGAGSPGPVLWQTPGVGNGSPSDKQDVCTGQGSQGAATQPLQLPTPPTHSTTAENPAQNAATPSPTQTPTPSPTDTSNYLLQITMTLSHNPMITRFLFIPLNPHLRQTPQSPPNRPSAEQTTTRTPSPSPPISKSTKTSTYPKPSSSSRTPTAATWKSKKWTLRDVIERREWEKEDGTMIRMSDEPGEKRVHLRYLYDVGDGWEHRIGMLGRADPDLHRLIEGPQAPRVLCFGGEGHPCAEDCGSEPGWEELKEAFRKPRRNRERREWYRTVCANGDSNGLDPYRWDLEKISKKLGRRTRKWEI
ncbi:MAG: hypothetical protein Q9219_004430 [cf. Caloplaca sp. 3 TL-2023]